SRRVAHQAPPPIDLRPRHGFWRRRVMSPPDLNPNSVGPLNAGADGYAAENGVREPSSAPVGNGPCHHSKTSPAHRSVRILAERKETWREVDDQLQWCLQQSK